jgi:acyl transferase domain-containing protein
LERAPRLATADQRAAQIKQASNLFILSAKSSTSLQSNISALCEHIGKIAINNEQEYLTSLSNTLCNHRTRFRHTHAIAASSLKDLTEKLRLPLPPSRTGDDGPLVFVFTGQGAQWARMGHSLMHNDNYNETMQEADRCLRDLGASWSLIGQLLLRCDAGKAC